MDSMFKQLSKRMTKRLVLGDIIAHGLLTLILHGAGKSVSIEEHLLALAFAVPGLMICYVFFVLARRFYAQKWARVMFGIPLIGDFLTVIPLVIPIGLYVPIVMCSNIANASESLWTLLSVVGVICGACWVQIFLIHRDLEPDDSDSERT